MLIFGMGLYGLFISNVHPEVPSTLDRALKGSSLFGMFALKVSRHLVGRYHNSNPKCLSPLPLYAANMLDYHYLVLISIILCFKI